MWYMFTLALYAVINTGSGSKVLTRKKSPGDIEWKGGLQNEKCTMILFYQCYSGK